MGRAVIERIGLHDDPTGELESVSRARFIPLLGPGVRFDLLLSLEVYGVIRVEADAPFDITPFISIFVLCNTVGELEAIKILEYALELNETSQFGCLVFAATLFGSHSSMQMKLLLIR